MAWQSKHEAVESAHAFSLPRAPLLNNTTLRNFGSKACGKVPNDFSGLWTKSWLPEIQWKLLSCTFTFSKATECTQRAQSGVWPFLASATSDLAARQTEPPWAVPGKHFCSRKSGRAFCAETYCWTHYFRLPRAREAKGAVLQRTHYLQTQGLGARGQRTGCSVSLRASNSLDLLIVREGCAKPRQSNSNVIVVMKAFFTKLLTSHVSLSKPKTLQGAKWIFNRWELCRKYMLLLLLWSFLLWPFLCNLSKQYGFHSP